MNWKVCGGF